MESVLTSDQCKSWEKHGKNEFIDFCKGQVSDNLDISQWNLKQGFYELFWHSLRNKLKSEAVCSVLEQVYNHDQFIPSLIADVLNIIDNETQCNAECTDSDEDKQTRDRFIQVLQACTNLLPEALLKERIEADTLESAGMLGSKSMFTQKYVKTKTRLYYKQQKFNLLREESEGYSKLITELQQDFTQTGASYQQVLDNIRSLIGGFNLDPNRVLDILLESFESSPEQDDFMVPLLRSYTRDRFTVCHILGFKFHSYQQTQDSETPDSLYRLAALLLHHGLVDLNILYPHLAPGDAEIVEKHKSRAAEAKEYERKTRVVTLADSGTKGKDNASDKVKDEDEQKDKFAQILNNQKVGLVAALLEVGSWQHARQMIDRLPPFFAVSHTPVAQAMAKLLHYLIDKLYQQHSGLPPLLMKCRSFPDGGRAAKRVKQPASWAELHDIVLPMLSQLGPHIHCDSMLMAKLLRLATAFINMKEKAPVGELASYEDVFRGFLTIMDECILPALTLLPSHCCLSEQAWGFLKRLKYEHRYRLYGQWKNDSHTMHPKLMCARVDVLERAKYIMKRLAKENVKQLGRQLGKLSHSNPGAVFEYVLTQIQKYDNFIGPVVDSLKFLTSLSYDMLAYCIMEALANPDRERMKHDDTNISMWLQSLANFSGAIFKKYQIELGGLLQYVVNQLKAGKSYDLLILREIIQKMVGIEVSEEVTDDQLDAMSGGDLLKQEGGQYSQVRNTKKSSSRLKDALLEHDLALPLCLSMAQQRNGILFTPTSNTLDGDKRHLKLIGKLYDQCHDTCVQFISFLGTVLSSDVLQRRVAPVDTLMDTYFLPPDVAFALTRLTANLQATSKWEELKKADRKDKEKQTTAAKTQRYIEACSSVTEPLVARLSTLTLSNVSGGLSWEDLTPVFYATFWTLGMSDLHVPTSAYAKQVSQLRMQIVTIEENNDMAQSKKKKEKERCISLIDKLQEEEKRQGEHVARVMARLKHDKDQWFVSKSQKRSTVTSLLQMCLFPRCCFTASDALYSAKFLHVLHKLKTPNFSSLICYDRILADITWPMTSCTENEAHRYGRFLCAIFEDIMRWHSDKGIFDKECGNFPGFKTVFRNRQSPTDKESSVADQLDYENYRHLCHKWHYHMTKVLMACMESTEFVQMRNALIVLTRILPYFPRLFKFGSALEKKLEKVCQEQREKRPDLYALGMGLCGQMKLRKKNWVNESEFHVVKSAAKPVKDETAAVKKEAGAEASVKAESMADKTDKDGKSGSASSKVKPEVIEIKDEHKEPSKDGDSRKDKSRSCKEKKDRKDKKESRKEKSDDSKSRSGTAGSKDNRLSDGAGRNNSPIGRGHSDDIDGRSRGGDKERNRGSGAGLEREGPEEPPKRVRQSDGAGRREESRRGGAGADVDDGRAVYRERRSQELDDGGRYRGESARVGDRDAGREKRGSSVQSSGSELTVNDPSPRYADRDSKRRKVDASRGKSPTNKDRSDREKHRDRGDRKRDHSFDNSPAEKRHKTEDHLVKAKQIGDTANGDSASSSKRSKSRDRPTSSREAADNHVTTPTHAGSANKKSPRRKESPEKLLRKSEKHVSKKSKHHER